VAEEVAASIREGGDAIAAAPGFGWAMRAGRGMAEAGSRHDWRKKNSSSARR